MVIKAGKKVRAMEPYWPMYFQATSAVFFRGLCKCHSSATYLPNQLERGYRLSVCFGRSDVG